MVENCLEVPGTIVSASQTLQTDVCLMNSASFSWTKCMNGLQKHATDVLILATHQEMFLLIIKSLFSMHWLATCQMRDDNRFTEDKVNGSMEE